MLPSVTRKVQRSFNARDFGAVSGMTDATAAIQAAHTAAKAFVNANDAAWAEVVIPTGVWNIATAGGIVLDTPRIRLVQQGGVIRKMVNGAIFTIDYTAASTGEDNIGDGVQLVDLFIDANYRSGFTGITMTFAHCADFTFRASRIIDGHVGSTLIMFTVAGQVRRRITNCYFRIAGTPQTFGIFDTSIDNGALPAPNFNFESNDCGGTPIDARGCNNLFLRGNNCSNILTDSISNKLLAIANRVASSGDVWTINGSNHLIDNNEANVGDIVLGFGLHNSYIGENHAIAGTTSLRIIDHSASTTNQIWDRPIKASVGAKHGVNQTLTSGVITVLAFNGERWNLGGASVHDPVTLNTRFWLRRKGDWILGAVAEFAANATGLRQLSLRLNGTTVELGMQQLPATAASAFRTGISRIWHTDGPSDLTADTTNGSPNLTNVAVANYSPVPTVGQAIEGPGIPVGARIGSIAGTTYGLVDAAGAAVNATATAAAIAAVATDYVEVRALQTSGGNLDVVAGGSNAHSCEAWARLL